MILTIAVLSLLVASLFSPQIAVEAKGPEQPAYAMQDVSSWLLRFAALIPDSSQPNARQCLSRTGQSAKVLRTCL